MPSAAMSPVIACSGAPLQTLEADVLAVPWFEGDTASAVADLDAASGGEIGRALASKEFAARAYDLFVTPVVDGSWRVRRVALIGAGARAEFSSDVARRLAVVAGLNARQRRADRAAFALRPDVVGTNDAAEFAQAVAEGLTLSEFNAGTYKTTDAAPAKTATWTGVVGSADAA